MIQSACIPQFLKLGLVFLCGRVTFLSYCSLYLALIQLCYKLVLGIVIEVGIYPQNGSDVLLRREIFMNFWIKLLHCWEFSQQLVFTTVWLMPYLCYSWLPLQIKNFVCFIFHSSFCSRYFPWKEIKDSGLCKHIQLKVQHTFNIITWFQAIQ